MNTSSSYGLLSFKLYRLHVEHWAAMSGEWWMEFMCEFVQTHGNCKCPGRRLYFHRIFGRTWTSSWSLPVQLRPSAVGANCVVVTIQSKALPRLAAGLDYPCFGYALTWLTWCDVKIWLDQFNLVGVLGPVLFRVWWKYESPSEFFLEFHICNFELH